MPKKTNNEPTLRERKLVQGVIEGKTKRQAAKDAGYGGSPETLSVRASKTLKKDNIQELMIEALSNEGISFKDIVAPVAKALKAKQIDKYRDAEGVWYEVETDKDDLEMQLKGHDRAAKMLGIKENDPNSGTIVVNFINMAAKQKEIYNL